MSDKARHQKENTKSNKLKKILRYILVIVFISCVIYCCMYFYEVHRDIEDHKGILDNIEIDSSKVNEDTTELMLQVEQLQKENNRIVGWLDIIDTDIKYPVCQSSDNEYYLTHNYKNRESKTGSLFLDKDCNIDNGCSNYLIYGHRYRQGLMFEKLIDFQNENFYKEHKNIRFATTKEDNLYEIVAVFFSKVYNSNEKDVFKYYYFTNAETEQEYNDFVTNAKKASLYDTGVTATYGEQLLTLSTCEYSQENGRFVIVAKKK